MSDIQKALKAARDIVDACAGDNRPAIEWASEVRAKIDATLAVAEREAEPVAERSFIYDSEDAPNMRTPPTSELEALRKRVVELEGERDEAIKAVGEQATLRGEAEGKLAASEMAGIVDGWKRRAEAYRTQLDEALKALEPFAAVAEHDIGDDETDDDIFWPISNARYSMSGRLRVAHLRTARRVREGGKVDG